MSPNKPLPSTEPQSTTAGVFPAWTRLGNRRGKSAVVSPTVTIFGAGISGLSAAHELIERGFSVQVVEPARSPDEEYTVEVGGMAANQFGRVKENPEVLHRPESELKNEDERAGFLDNVGRILLRRSAQTQRVQRRFPTPWRIQFVRRAGATVDQQPAVVNDLPDEWKSANSAKLVTALETFKTAIREYQGVGMESLGSWGTFRDETTRKLWMSRETLRVQIRGHANGDDTEQNNRDLSMRWAEAVKARLIELDNGSDDRIDIEPHLVCVPIGSAEPLGDQRDENWRNRSNRVEFRIIEQLVPGEHGYRFFPAFYRHLFDTMQRTPILNEHDQETGETAFDRLVPTRDFGLGLRDGRSTVSLQTRRLRSLEELRKHSQVFFERLGATFRDIARFEVRMLKFLTSSSERRQREYKTQSWWTFLGGDAAFGYSEKMKKFLTETPQALVAMNAEETDARSQGNIVSQLQLHYLENRFDSTLNGPTTSVWLREWKRYLERQGVRFFVGELGKLEWRKGELIPVTTHRSGWLNPRARRVRETDSEAVPPESAATARSLEDVRHVEDPADYSAATGAAGRERRRIPSQPKPRAEPPVVRPAQARILIEVLGNDEGDYTVFVDARAYCVSARQPMKAEDIARALADEIDTDPAVYARARGSQITLTEDRDVGSSSEIDFDVSPTAGTWEVVRKIKSHSVERHMEGGVGDTLGKALSKAQASGTAPDLSSQDDWVAAGVKRALLPEVDETLSYYEQSREPRREIVPKIALDRGNLRLEPPDWVRDVLKNEGNKPPNFDPMFTPFTSGGQTPYAARTRAPSLLIRVSDPHEHLRIVSGPTPENPLHEYRSPDDSRVEFRPDFYVLALPIEAASRLVWQAETSRKGALDGCLAELLKFDVCTARRARNGRQRSPSRDVHGHPAATNPLRDFSGVQYYFHNQVRIGKGHIYFPDAEWGLSSISQLAYWRERMSSNGAFMGQLSVDIGNFYATAPPRGGGRFTWSAWNSTADEIAKEVWFQVRQGLEKDRAGVLADPDYVHLDEGLRFDHPLGSSFRETASILVAKDKLHSKDPTHRGRYTIWVNGERFTHEFEEAGNGKAGKKGKKAQTVKQGGQPRDIARSLSAAINRSESGRLKASAEIEPIHSQVRPSAIVRANVAEAIEMIWEASDRQLDDLQGEERRNPNRTDADRKMILEAFDGRRATLDLWERDPESFNEEAERKAHIARLDALEKAEQKLKPAPRNEVLASIEARRNPLQKEETSFPLRITSEVPFEGALVCVTGTNAGSYELVVGDKHYRHVQKVGPTDIDDTDHTPGAAYQRAAGDARQEAERNAQQAAARTAIRDALFHQLVIDPDAAVVPEASGTAGLVLLPKSLKLARIEVRNEHQNLVLVFGPKLHIRIEQCHEGLSFEYPEQATVGYNQTPFLINVPGQWQHRPGVVGPGSSSPPALGPGDGAAKAVSYNISNRRWVAAGTFMATTTRLTTMEAANESARHAVNAILYQIVAGPEGSYSAQGKMFADWADIWDPEQNELDDLEPLKRLDKKLLEEGLPHVLDILKVIEAVDALPMHGKESRDPAGNVMHLLEHAGEAMGGDWGFAKELFSGLLAHGAERAHEQLDPLGLLRGLKTAMPGDLAERFQRAVKSFMEGPGK